MGSEVGLKLSYSKAGLNGTLNSMCYWTGEGLMAMMMVVMIEMLTQSPFNFLNIEKLMMKKKMWQTIFFPFPNELF